MNEKPPSVVRTPKRKEDGPRFARIDNAILQDRRLSYRARGVAAFVLSKQDDWRFSAELLALSGKEGAHALEQAIRELEEFGYVRRVRERDAAGHIRSRLELFESPTANYRRSAPTATLPTAGSPAGRDTDGRQTGGVRNDRRTNNSRTNNRGRDNHAAPTGKILFPWKDFGELPCEVRERFQATYRRNETASFSIDKKFTAYPDEWWLSSFQEIRSRKLKYRDSYAQSDWLAVLESEFRELSDSHRKEKNARHSGRRAGWA